LRDEVTFNNLVISGMRARVDPLTKLYAAKSTVKLEIDQRFLSRYGEEYGSKRIRIRVTRDLLAEDALLGRDVTVGDYGEAPTIELDGIAEKEARVEIDTTKMPSTITKPNHEYEGKINPSINVRRVTLEGPASAFTGDQVILVWVNDIEDALSMQQVPGEKGEAKLTRVEIGWQGVETDLLQRIRVRAQELGGDPMTVQDFRRRLVMSCEVIKRKVEKILADVPIEIRHPLPRKFDLVEDYGAYGGTFLDTDLKGGRKQELKVRLPNSLARNQDFLDNLVVVLDVGAAEEDPSTKDTLLVPYRLDLRDRSREQDVAGLPLVDIVPTGGQPAVQAIAEFRKKQ
jgi:hypothetical protein